MLFHPPRSSELTAVLNKIASLLHCFVVLILYWDTAWLVAACESRIRRSPRPGSTKIFFAYGPPKCIPNPLFLEDCLPAPTNNLVWSHVYVIALHSNKTPETPKALPIVTKVQRSKVQPTSRFLGIITSFGLLSSRSTYCKKHMPVLKKPQLLQKTKLALTAQRMLHAHSFLMDLFFPVLLPLILFWSSTTAGTCCLLFCTTLLSTTPVVVWFRAKPTSVSPHSTTWITFSRMMIVATTKMTVVVALGKSWLWLQWKCSLAMSYSMAHPLLTKDVVLEQDRPEDTTTITCYIFNEPASQSFTWRKQWFRVFLEGGPGKLENRLCFCSDQGLYFLLITWGPYLQKTQGTIPRWTGYGSVRCIFDRCILLLLQ
jgi:hypothetical protein